MEVKPIQSRLLAGKSTPAIRAIGAPNPGAACASDCCKSPEPSLPLHSVFPSERSLALRPVRIARDDHPDRMVIYIDRRFARESDHKAIAPLPPYRPPGCE